MSVTKATLDFTLLTQAALGSCGGSAALWITLPLVQIHFLDLLEDGRLCPLQPDGDLAEANPFVE